MTRALLMVVALCAALAIGYVIGVRQAPRPIAPAPHVQIRTAPPAAAPAKRTVAKAAPTPAPAPVAPENTEAQVAEDAAAVGMTTREPEAPSSIDDVLEDNAAAAPPPENAPSN